jgi:hypothetical protein
MATTLLSDDEFNRLIQQVDSDIQRAGISITARPLLAISTVARLLDTSIAGFHRSKSMPGVYSHDTLASHIDEWYKNKYGKRLNICFDINSVVVVIRDDPWRLNLPMIGGEVLITCDPGSLDRAKSTISYGTPGNPPLLNVLNCIDGLTERLANSLTPEELAHIEWLFKRAYNNLSQLELILNKQYIPEAKSDFKIAVDSILSHTPNFGMSKWSSLQFVEKLLKAYMSEAKIEIKKIHSLKKLNELAKSDGFLQGIPDKLIGILECDPGARYDMSSVASYSAIMAHHASIEACFHMANPIRIRHALVKI